MNIRLRLTLWYTAILFLILVIFGGVVYLGLRRNLLVTIDNQLQREAAQIIGEIHIENEGEDESDEYQKVGDVEVELE